MSKINFNLSFWQHTSPDYQVYQKLAKHEKKVFKEMCSTRGRYFIDKIISGNKKKYLSFLMQMLCLGHTHLRRNCLKAEYSSYSLKPGKIISTMIGLDKEYTSQDMEYSRGGYPTWDAPQGKKQSHTYRLNKFQDSMDYFYYRLANGELNIPLIWRISSPVLCSGFDYNHRTSSSIKIKMVGKNKLEVGQLWKTMIQIPLGMTDEYVHPILIGPLEYHDQSNTSSVAETIDVYANLIKNAKEHLEYLELASEQAQQNIAVINSTVIMANSTYGQ